MGDVFTKAIRDICDQTDRHTSSILIICLLKRLVNILAELANWYALSQARANTLEGDQTRLSDTLALLERLDD